MSRGPLPYPTLNRTQAPNISEAAYEQLMQATAPMRLGAEHGTYDIGRENAKAEIRDIVVKLHNGQYS